MFFPTQLGKYFYPSQTVLYILCRVLYHAHTHRNFIHFVDFLKAYLSLRERDRVEGREGQRERERESQAGSALPAGSPMWGLNSTDCKTMTGAKTKSRTLNRLSYPGVLYFFCCWFLNSFLFVWILGS